MPDIVQVVQQKLGIKYVDAKALVAEAKQVCEIVEGDDVPTERHDEVVEEACEMFADYTPAQQNSMKQQNATRTSSSSSSSPAAAAAATATIEPVVPAWKQKALAACAKLESDYASKQSSAQATEEMQRRLRQEGVPEDQVASTTVTQVRKLEEPAAAAATETASAESAAKKLTVRTYTCACVIQ